jgi:hypothetical protein
MLVATLFATGCVTQSDNGQAGSSILTPTKTLIPTTLSTGAGTTTAVSAGAAKIPYPVVDTGQGACFNAKNQITCPQQGKNFFGQDAQYTETIPAYQLSSDALTVNDKNTGLTWQRSPDTNGDGSITVSDKLTWTQAQAYPATLNAAKYGGYSDWHLPTIKEQYSLMDFRGTDPSGFTGTDTSGLTPFIDTDYFNFAYGQTSAGERIIDSQYASSNLYSGNSMNGGQLLFGVNFADGRIKGYGLTLRNSDKTFFVTCVRGNPAYGINSFIANGDGTITDKATGLMWSQSDSATGMDWQDALLWVQQKNTENYLGHNDWRLPNAKELQGIVNYSRSPDTTSSAAIDPLFSSTQITNEAGQADYPFYWTGTTHASSNGMGAAAVYIAFGRAMGYMDGQWQDVHGAGAQRSDPKVGNASDYPQGNGPQGDAIRIDNYVRLVRGGDVTETPEGNPTATYSVTSVESTGNSTGGQSGPTGASVTGQVPRGGQQVGPGSSPGMSPPPESITACSSRTAGDTCSFTSPTGLVSGTCKEILQQMACVPADAPDQ